MGTNNYVSWQSCMVTALALCALIANAAQDYPSKPIRIILPIAPGGGQDFIARLVGQKLATAVAQSVVIDNRPGAGGNIGAELAARALPDGYTLVVVAASFTIQPSLYSKMSYDPVRDFVPIMQLGGQGYVLVVPPSVSARTIKEFVALAKSTKGGMTYASSGNGELSHMGMELLKMRAEFNAVHVPYKGTQPALVALMSRQVDTYFSSIGATLPLVASAKLRALAVTTLNRVPVLSDVPTIAESGYPEYEVNGWHGLLAPARTPPAIVAKLHHEVFRILELPDVKEIMAVNGRLPVAGGNTPKEFAAIIRSEIGQWAKLIKAANIKVE